MNNYCAYLNIPFPLFRKSVITSQLPKIAHFKLKQYEYLSVEIQTWIQMLQLNIILVEGFYTTPHTTGTVHIDSIGGDYTKLNWQFGGMNSVMNWYSTNKLATPQHGTTLINSNSIRFETHEVTKVHSQPIQNPSLVQVGAPHNVENFEEDRWVISVVFRHRHSPYSRPTWQESLNIFKDYLVPRV